MAALPNVPTLRLHRASVFIESLLSHMKRSTDGFTLLELVVVIGMAGALMLLLGSAAANTQPNVRAIQCLAHLRQLTAGWTMYAREYTDRVPNNFPVEETYAEINGRRFGTWACDVMSWTIERSITNVSYLQSGLLGPYL